jgi:hypothetical protein
MELTVEQAMAIIEVRELLRSRGIEVDTMSDEEIVGFVNRAVHWIADLIDSHESSFTVIRRLAHEQNNAPPQTNAEDSPA